MTTPINVDAIMNQPDRVRTLRRAVETIADRATPFVELWRPFVDGLEKLPGDGRFLLVGNHTQLSAEALLIPYFARQVIGRRVRPLADRQFGNMGGWGGDLLAAAGVVIGAPETARELMLHSEPILVFPGGGREIAKFKGEENSLRWEGRAGFARLAVEHEYPIVPVGLVGGDDVYRSLVARDSRWGRLSLGLTKKLSGRSDFALPLMRGLGPTLIPRPQRMYLRFADPIVTTKPARVSREKWVATIKQTAQVSLEQTLGDLVELRRSDPYRTLNPLAWHRAMQPAGAESIQHDRCGNGD